MDWDELGWIVMDCDGLGWIELDWDGCINLDLTVGVPLLWVEELIRLVSGGPPSVPLCKTSSVLLC